MVLDAEVEFTNQVFRTIGEDLFSLLVCTNGIISCFTFCWLYVAEANKHGRRAEADSKGQSLITNNVAGHDGGRGTVFNYRDLATATRNFHPDTFLGEGGFGSVYKGKLLDTGEVCIYVW